MTKSQPVDQMRTLAPLYLSLVLTAFAATTPCLAQAPLPVLSVQADKVVAPMPPGFLDYLKHDSGENK